MQNSYVLLVIGTKKILFLEQPLAHRLAASLLLTEQESVIKTPHVEVPGKRKSFRCSSYLPKLFSVVHSFFCVTGHWTLVPVCIGSCLYFFLTFVLMWALCVLCC